MQKAFFSTANNVINLFIMMHLHIKKFLTSVKFADLTALRPVFTSLAQIRLKFNRNSNSRDNKSGLTHNPGYQKATAILFIGKRIHVDDIVFFIFISYIQGGP